MAATSSAGTSAGVPLRLSGYVVLAELGPGPNARTCKVREKPHRDVPPYMDDLEPCFALKCIDLAEKQLTSEDRARAVQEMQQLLNLQHPQIVRYHRAFLYEGRLCYMTEFAECGTLHHMVYTVKERGRRLPDALVWHLFTQVCHGLKKLHDCQIVHRTLKTRNLLLFPEKLYTHAELKYRCKITDIGIPELQRHLRLSALPGSTLRYLAPEVLGQGPTDEKVDVWALGCILYEMATLSHAFNATSAIQRAEYAPIPDHVSGEMRDLLVSMLQLDPAARPSVAELLSTPALVRAATEMPNPTLLDSPSTLPPPPSPACSPHGAAATSAGAPAADCSGSDAEIPAPSGPPATHTSLCGALDASGDQQRSMFAPGMPCWAQVHLPPSHLPPLHLPPSHVPPSLSCSVQYASDGLWYRGIVHSPIDDSCCFVRFEALRCVDVVWWHGLRVSGSSGNDGSGGAEYDASGDADGLRGTRGDADGDLLAGGVVGVSATRLSAYQGYEAGLEWPGSGDRACEGELGRESTRASGVRCSDAGPAGT